MEGGAQTAAENETPITNGCEYFRIMRYIKNKWAVVITVFLHFTVGALPVIMTILMGDMVDVFSSDNFLEDFIPVILNMVYYVIGMFIAGAASFAIRTWCNSAFARDLRDKVYRNLVEQGIDFFDRTPTGVLIGRLSQEITLIQETYYEKLLNSFQKTGESLAGIIISFVKCWRLAFPGVVVLLFCLLIFVIGDKIIANIWIKYNDCLTAANNKAEEAISSFRTIKSFDNEIYESANYKEQLDSVNNVFFKTGIAQGTKDGIIATLSNLMVAGICYFGGDLAINKSYYGYHSGDIFIVFFSLIMAVDGLTQAVSISNDMNKSAISAQKILELIEMRPEVDRKEGDKLKNVKGKIEFRNVYFKYQNTEKYAVQNLSFTINPGETVAFVGESGCGKTTTLQLLQRFYEIESGQILIDDQDISKISGVDLRSHIAVVPQTPVLFSTSILDNIRYSKEDATKNEVIKAAQIGNAHEFITELPDGYKSIVRQTSLSGGQKQRICISRAILANSPILLLDEATSALDTESERLIHDSLEKFRKDRTVILVAHRLATVINADRILLFQNGQVVEEGTHQELIARNGLYADLVKYQLQ
ncbi:ABC transporter family protein [Histomonas meleagridis]|uniref:ABC transporter family protein n=1 Tax=Histomonas meleagridis TaxID=135588 RepID=UPI00355A40CB|nr:ABC transporter family protein [Histomonas meleagridis]KAH0797071.1 ABC transporter family protein [Histomonas meleagridis]